MTVVSRLFRNCFQANGYQTAMIGKWHLVSEPTGFDYWDILIGQGDYYNPKFIKNGERVQREGYATNIVTDLAINWMDSIRDKSKPFCLLFIIRLLIVPGCPIFVILTCMMM